MEALRSGEIFHILNDPMEEKTIDLKDLDAEQELLISSFKDVLKQMQ